MHASLDLRPNDSNASCNFLASQAGSVSCFNFPVQIFHYVSAHIAGYGFRKYDGRGSAHFHSIVWIVTPPLSCTYRSSTSPYLEPQSFISDTNTKSACQSFCSNLCTRPDSWFLRKFDWNQIHILLISLSQYQRLKALLLNMSFLIGKCRELPKYGCQS